MRLTELLEERGDGALADAESFLEIRDLGAAVSSSRSQPRALAARMAGNCSAGMPCVTSRAPTTLPPCAVISPAASPRVSAVAETEGAGVESTRWK
jgi:hypothetical protein